MVVLDDPALPGYRLSLFGTPLEATRLMELPAVIRADYVRVAPPGAARLRERFDAGLREALDPAAQPPGQRLSSGTMQATPTSRSPP